MPAVLDLRQEFPNVVDVLLAPSVYLEVAQLDDLRGRHFLSRDVATQSPGVDAQSLGSFSR